MADVVYLDQSKAFDYEYIKALQKEGRRYTRTAAQCCKVIAAISTGERKKNVWQR